MSRQASTNKTWMGKSENFCPPPDQVFESPWSPRGEDMESITSLTLKQIKHTHAHTTHNTHTHTHQG